MTDPSGRVTRFGYYRNGVLETLTDPDGATTTWGIDLQSRPVRHAPVIHVPAVAVGTIAATVAAAPRAPAPPPSPRVDGVLAVLAVLAVPFAGSLAVLLLHMHTRRLRGRPRRSRQTSSTTWFPP